MTTLGHFHHGRGNVLFLLEYTLTLDTDLPSLHAILLPQLRSTDFQKALSTVTVFQAALLWIREITSQQKKCSSGPCSWNSLGLSCSRLPEAAGLLDRHDGLWKTGTVPAGGNSLQGWAKGLQEALSEHQVYGAGLPELGLLSPGGRAGNGGGTTH